METENKSNNIYIELGKTLDVIGEERLIAVLQNERHGTLKSNDPLVIFIFRIVSDTIGVTTDKIINSSERNSNRKYSTAFIVYYLFNECGLSLREISTMIKKSRTVLCRHKRIIEGINLNYKPVKWAEKKSYFDMSINNFKLSLK